MIIVEYIKCYFSNFYQVFSAMAPWLLLGYLLAGIIAFILTPEIVKKHLNGGGFKTILKAVLLGVPLPLCSCGVIPVAASLRQEGAGKGATGAFFISTPQTGIDNLLLTGNMIGWGVALVRLIIAYLTGLIGGYAIDLACGKDEDIEKHEEKKCCCCHSHQHIEENKKWKNAPKFILHYGFIKMMRSMSPSLLLGIFLAALIQTLLPEDFGAKFIGDRMYLQFIIVVALSLPLYVCSNAAVPIAAALVLRGFSPGAALVFLIAGPGISSVSITSMKAMLGTKATIISVAVIMIMAFIGGFAVNYLNLSYNTEITKNAVDNCIVYLKHASAIILGILLIYALYNRYFKKQ